MARFLPVIPHHTTNHESQDQSPISCQEQKNHPFVGLPIRRSSPRRKSVVSCSRCQARCFLLWGIWCRIGRKGRGGDSSSSSLRLLYSLPVRREPRLNGSPAS